MSVMSNSLAFLGEIGMYDVVLPFLLIFTIVFGILEKSKIFGSEKVGDKTYSRKNLNAMVAFCTGFFVVASTQLVAIINEFVAGMALILLIIIMFMIMVATFHKQQDADGLDLTKWMTPLVTFVIISIVLIFLSAANWLDVIWAYIAFDWDSTIVGTLALLLIIAGAMWLLVRTPKEKKSDS
ncbi:hypothetical protein GOV11_01415 [Candidatus Woesearchaeota archaeon]|nr:hypothetical protein [Candidatus Woesearchaeota archaeon]